MSCEAIAARIGRGRARLCGRPRASGIDPEKGACG